MGRDNDIVSRIINLPNFKLPDGWSGWSSNDAQMPDFPETYRRPATKIITFGTTQTKPIQFNTVHES